MSETLNYLVIVFVILCFYVVYDIFPTRKSRIIDEFKIRNSSLSTNYRH